MTKCSDGEWVDRFMNRLGVLMPSMTPDDANQHAISTLADANNLNPEEAADVFALELPPTEAGEPSDDTVPGVRLVPSIVWAQAFTDRWHELSGGAMDMSHTLDWGYELYAQGATLSPVAVAEREWDAGAAERAVAGL